MPLDFRVANAVVSYVAYIGKMLWPAGLAALYPFPETLPGWQVFGSLFVLIGVTLAVLRAGPRRAYLAVGWFWYLGTLVPVIGLVQAGQQAMADRYSYVPLIGLLIMAGWGIPELLGNWRHRSRALSAVSVAAILACAVVARGQVRYWENDNLLWTHALEVTSGNYVAHNNLGTALVKEGKPQEALAHYAEALRIRPDYLDVYYNVGTIFMDQQRFGDAMAAYSEVLRRKPDHAYAHNNVGVLLKNLGRIDEAIAHYSEAVRLDPGHANAHYNLGNALASQGKVAEAIEQYTRALELRPANETMRSALEELRSRQ
jgi:tetratricopeptide (TPR) repeat protein